MCEIQLELNIENNSLIDSRLHELQLQIDAINASMSKVRKKLFAQVSELQKTCMSLELQNQDLVRKLRELSQEKEEWKYLEGDNLFQLACS